MNWNYLCSAAAVAALSGPAFAESLDRNALPLDMLWESGNSVRFSFTQPNPSVSAVPAGGTGSVLSKYTTAGFAYKRELNDRVDFGVFLNEPYGADGSSTGDTAGGRTLSVNSMELAAVVKYKFDNNVSVYGGLRAVETSIDMALPDAGGYSLKADKDYGFGLLAGVAKEIPERGMRFGVTYHSKVKHSFDSIEFGAAPGTTTATMPQSLTIDGRMALNSSTLLFGSAKWADYSEFNLFAPTFAAAVVPGASVINYTKDSITANMGLGRKINDEWSVFGIVDWTKKDGRETTLRPTDGGTGLTLGANYASGQIKITGGVQYKRFSDVTIGGANYTGGTALTPFLQVGYSF